MRSQLDAIIQQEVNNMRRAALKLLLYKLGIISAKPHPDFRIAKRYYEAPHDN